MLGIKIDCSYFAFISVDIGRSWPVVSFIAFRFRIRRFASVFAFGLWHFKVVRFKVLSSSMAAGFVSL